MDKKEIMDKYEIGFKISECVCKSNEPLEEIKYFKKIIEQSWKLYHDRENIRFKGMRINEKD